MKATKHLRRWFTLSVCLALVLSLLPIQLANAASANIVISQVYGGGGNSGATYKNDFVELYNRGATTASVAGWSIQYASATGTGSFGANAGQLTPLPNVSIPPGHYLLIQEAAGTGGTKDLPTPDVTDGTPILMSATGGKVALVDMSTSLGCNGGSSPCSPDQLAHIIDLVGWDGANFYEGAGPAPATTNPFAILRVGNGTQDTDNNNADFVVGAPLPRNSLYPFVVTGAATPNVLFAGDATLLTVAVVPNADPPSTGLAVTVDLSAIGGLSSQIFYDDGTNGDVTAGDNVFTFDTTVDAGTAAGVKSLPFLVTDEQGRSINSNISLTVVTILPIGTVNGPVLDTDIGTAHTSPYVGQLVAIQGVIYEKSLQAISNTTNTYKGFYIQNTSTTKDADANTSDGIFAFMNTNSDLAGPDGPYTPAVGDEVVIVGMVSEYYNMTELVNPFLIEPVVRSGVDIEAELPAIEVNPPTSLADANRYWERMQGMRVQIPANSIVLGGRNVFNPADAEIWLAREDSTIAQRADEYTRRAFRDAHVLDDNYDPNNWDGNGYRILMGSLGIKATLEDAQALIEPARTYDTLVNAPVGGLNYTFSKYRVEITTQPEFNQGTDPAANNPPEIFDPTIHYSIVDYNLENLYDYRDNPFSGCDFAGNSGCAKISPFLADINPPYDYVPASDEAYQARLTDIATQIVNDLNSPDILMVQEIENQDFCTVTDSTLTCGVSDNADGKPDVLQDLALKIASLGGPVYVAAFDRNSSDLRGITPAFLYKADRVELLPPAGDPVLGSNPSIVGYSSVPYDSDVSNPKTLNATLPGGVTPCETSWVFPRAPSIALFRIYSSSIDVGSHRDVYVINNHFKSGPDTCVAHRKEQAKYNAALVAFLQAANPEARIVVGGDLNVYPRPDDPFAPIGLPGSSDQLGSLYNSALGLTNLWEVLLGQAPEAAYSYVYVGMAQTLDQMIINQPLLANLEQFRIAHINSDFPAEYPDDVARGTSDHDPNVATFIINDPPTVDAGGPYTVTEGTTVTLTAIGEDPENEPLTYAWDLNDDGIFETPGQSVTFDASALVAPASFTVKVQVTDNGGLTAEAETEVRVIFNWSGFFSPVENPPVINIVTAGSAIPIKFSLSGDRGMDIFMPGYPISQKFNCATGQPVGNPSIAEFLAENYDPLVDQYVFVWKTNGPWKNTCRQFTFQLIDGTTHVAYFDFTP